MIGKVISHYRVLERVGAGGMGVVYKATDDHLDRVVALKFLRTGDFPDPQAVRRFRDEASALCRLHHPHIMNVYDFDEVDGNAFISMEYLEGVTLRAMLSAGPLTTENGVRLIRQACMGIGYAHGKGFLHRDIKPDNIMLTHDGTVKVMDFGLARMVTPWDTTRLTSFEGTLPYCAPEVLRDEPEDERRDIYALGVTLCEVLTGARPHTGTSASSLVRAILEDPPALPSSLRPRLSPSIDHVVARCLDKDPARRYANVNELVADLDACLAGEELRSAAEPPLVARPSLGRSVGRVVAVAAAIGTLTWIGTRFGDVFDGASPAEEQLLAVVPFTNQSGDQSLDWLSMGIPVMLTSDLSRSPQLQVLSLQRLHELLTSMGMDVKDLSTGSVAMDVARRGNAGLLLTGFYMVSDVGLAIDGRVIDVVTGEMIGAQQVVAPEIESVLTTIGDLGTGLRKAVGRFGATSALAAVQGSGPEITTSSIDAFKQYVLGEEAWMRWELPAATGYLEKAVAIDTTFALAYMRLADTYMWLAEQERGLWAIDHALEHSARASNRDRMMIQAQHFKWHGEEESARDVLEQLTTAYPLHREGFSKLGDILMDLHSKGMAGSEGAIEAYRQAIRIEPGLPILYNDLGYAFAAAGRYDEAVDALGKYVKLSPGDPNPLDSMGELYAQQGRFREALQAFDSALAVNPRFVVSLQNRAVFGLDAGDYEESIVACDRLEDVATTAGLEATACRYRAGALRALGKYEAAAAELEREVELRDSLSRPFAYLRLATHYTIWGRPGEADEALRLAAQEEAEGTSEWVRYHEAWMALERDDPDFARGIVEELRSEEESHRNWSLSRSLSILQARIAMTTGDPEGALDHLSLARKYIDPGIYQGERELEIDQEESRALFAAGRVKDAVERVESLLAVNPRSVSMRYLHARILQAGGDVRGARRQLDSCLELWKDGDPEFAYRTRVERALDALEHGAPIERL